MNLVSSFVVLLLLLLLLPLVVRFDASSHDD